MKEKALNEKSIYDIDSPDKSTSCVKAMSHKGFMIIALRRKLVGRKPDKCLDWAGLTSWWCGYVETLPRIAETMFLDKSDSPYGVYRSTEYILYEPHGGFTYSDAGVPMIGLKFKHFLGWDYNHNDDKMDEVSYEDVFNEGMKVIDSMFECASGC
ncbi:MAG: hypothetical protein ACI4XN_07325 [Candidatus Kurthia intestinigallinarum]